MIIDLKPCPFCGGTPVMDHLGRNQKTGFYVHCDSCEVQQIAIHTLESAAEKWNSRAPQPCDS